MIIYNPLAKQVKSWVSLPVVGLNNEITDLASDKPIVSHSAPINEKMRDIAERTSSANYRLIFQADLPALGFKSFLIRKNRSLRQIGTLPVKLEESSNFNIKNNKLGLKFDSGGNLIGIDNFESGISAPIKQSMCFYDSKSGYSRFQETQVSGAYVFR